MEFISSLESSFLDLIDVLFLPECSGADLILEGFANHILSTGKGLDHPFLRIRLLSTEWMGELLIALCKASQNVDSTNPLCETSFLTPFPENDTSEPLFKTAVQFLFQRFPEFQNEQDRTPSVHEHVSDPLRVEKAFQNIVLSKGVGRLKLQLMSTLSSTGCVSNKVKRQFDDSVSSFGYRIRKNVH